MRFFSKIPLFAALTTLVFTAEALSVVAVVSVSDAGWSRSMWPVTLPLSVAVMVVAAALAAHFSIQLARRVLLGGVQARLDRVEDARSESHRQIATMTPAVAMFAGGLESQRRLLDSLQAYLLPAAEKLAGEHGAHRAARVPLLNAISVAAGLARETDHRISAVAELQARVGRAAAAHRELLFGLRELQDLVEALPGFAEGATPAPSAARRKPASPTERLIADAIDQAQLAAPDVKPAALDALPEALRQRLQQRSLGLDADGYDLGLN